MENENLSLGLYLQNRRNELGMSQKDVANVLGVSTQAIYKYEHELSFPDLSIIYSYANILKVSVESFITLNNEKSDIDNNPFDINKFSNNLKKLRNSRGYTLATLENLIGVKYQTISKWERSESLPNIKQFLDLSKIYNVSINDLYYGNINGVSITNNDSFKTHNRKRVIIPLIVLSSLAVASIATTTIILVNKNNNNKKNIDSNNELSEIVSSDNIEEVISSSDIEDSVYESSEISISDITNEAHTVTFNYGKHNDSIKMEINDGNTINMPNVEIKGYTINSYNYNGNLFDFSTPITENMTLDANITPNTYTITYNTSGGSLKLYNQDVTYDSYITLPTECEKDGYSFAGWQYNDEYVNNNIQYKFDHNIVLDAIFIKTGDAFTYSLSDNSITINNYIFGDVINIYIPNQIDGYDVKRISKNAFANNKNANRIVIPQSVEIIEKGALSGMDSLEKITIPNDNIALIDMFGISNEDDFPSNLYNIEFTGNLETVNEGFFKGISKMFSVTFSGATSNIRKFNNIYNVKELHLPSTINSFDYDCFSNCIGLEDVYYDGTIYDWINIDFLDWLSSPMRVANNLYLKDENNNYYLLSGDIVLNESIETIKKSAFSGIGNVTSITIPDSVYSIDDYAFSWMNDLETVYLPDDLKKISWGMFERSGISHINLPSKLITIDHDAFRSCKNLKEIKIPDSVISFGEEAFHECISLEYFIFTNNMISIPHRFLYECKNIKWIIIPNTITYIGDQSLQLNGSSFECIYYIGTEDEFNQIEVSTYNNSLFEDAPKYYYSKTYKEGNYWHYDENNMPTKWN